MLRAGLLKLGGSMLGQLLSADPGQRGPRLPCGLGHEAEFTDYRDKVIGTVLGPVTLRRAWYHCAECKHGFAPRDAELGVGGTSLSPGLAAMNDIAAVAGPFAKAAGLLENLAGVSLTVKRVERAAEASGAAQSAAVRERSAAIAGRKVVPLPPSPCPDMLYGAIDGTGVTMTAKETAGRQGKGEDGRARTREVKLAVFFTQDEIDDDGYPVRDPGSASYIATFEPASVFGAMVKAEGIRRGADHVRQLTILGDGAAWIWGIAADKFPEATQIVDLFHAREHLNSLARSLEFMLLGRKDQWLAARLEDLDYGDIDGRDKIDDSAQGTTYGLADPPSRTSRVRAPPQARPKIRTKAAKFAAPDSTRVILYRIDPVENHSLPDGAAPRRRRRGAGEADVKSAQILDGLGRRFPAPRPAVRPGGTRVALGWRQRRPG